MRNKIRERRIAMGMNQEQVAGLLGTTPATISRLETGGMTLSTKWLERIGEVLQVDPRDLLDPSVSDSTSGGLVADSDGYIPIKGLSSFLIATQPGTSLKIRMIGTFAGFQVGDTLSAVVERGGVSRLKGQYAVLVTQGGLRIMRNVPRHPPLGLEPWDAFARGHYRQFAARPWRAVVVRMERGLG